MRILHRDVLALSILQLYSPTGSDFNQHFALWAFKYAGLDLSYLASSSVFSRTACAMVSASWYFFLLLLSSFTESCSSAWITVSCSMHWGAKHRHTHTQHIHAKDLSTWKSMQMLFIKMHRKQLNMCDMQETWRHLPNAEGKQEQLCEVWAVKQRAALLMFLSKRIRKQPEAFHNLSHCN